MTTCPSCDKPLTLVDHTFFLGKTIGKYLVEEVLGVGGMGIVFKGRHRTLDKKVAIKVFIPREGDVSVEKRFLREARFLASLLHPNIIEVHDFDISEWGTPFYVMRFLEGRTLDAIINQYPHGLPHDMFSDMLKSIVRALAYAHNKGIVHRDLKPENIFVEEVGEKQVVKILDFGIAKSLTGGEGSTRLTADETVLGTPFYLAPEQVANKGIGAHTDQYALALITAEMLSGKVVRGGKNVGEILFTEVRRPIQLDDPKFNAIPLAVKHVIIKATSPRPSKRFHDIESFGNVLLNAFNKSSARKAPVVGDTCATVSKHPSREKFMSIEEEVQWEETQKRKKKRRLTAAAAVVLAAAVIYVLGPFGVIDIFHISKGDKTQKIQKDFITLRQTLTVPKDADSILTYRHDTLVVRGAEKIYLINIKGMDYTSNVPFKGKIIRGLTGGKIAFVNDRSITARDLIAGTESSFLTDVPPGKVFKISASAKYLAVKNGAALTLYGPCAEAEKEKKYCKIKTIPIPETDTGLAVTISDEYLVLCGGGEIRVFLPASGKEVLSLPFEIAARFAAVHDRGGFLVVGGDDNTVYLYDLKKGMQIESIPVAGDILAIGFFPRSPVLVIAKEGILLFRKLPSGRLPLFGVPGSKIIDMIVTPHGLVVLDKKRSKINIYSYDEDMI
jgi:serine/threonine-protein kinase